MRGDVKVIRSVRVNVLIIAAAATFAACASSPPAGSPTASSAPAPAAAVAPATAATASADTGNIPFVTPRGFRVETRNGENYYCQRMTRTGSRAKATETCYTLAEITQMRESGQDFINRMQTAPGMGQSVDGNGGVTNSAVSNMNTQ
jgi:hypothetical protein